MFRHNLAGLFPDEAKKVRNLNKLIRTKKISKKGDLLGQPFVFILVLMVIALTFIFGFKMINNLRETQEKVKYVDFKTGLGNTVNDVYNANDGTRIVFSRTSSHSPLYLPRDVKEVCVEGEEVSFKLFPNSKNSFPNFDIKHLTGAGTGKYCIETVSGYLSFTLENVAKREEVFVVISKNE
jgi:hypothetical protein